MALFNHFERAKELKDKNAVLVDDLGAFGWVAAELVDWSYAPFGSAVLFFMGAIRGWYCGKGLEEFVRELAARFPKETRQTHMMATVAIACGGEEFDPKSARSMRAAQADRIIAELGFNLITDGGSGTIGIVAKHYCSVANRAGRSIGVFAGLAGFDDAVVDKLVADDIEPKHARMPWIEVPI